MLIGAYDMVESKKKKAKEITTLTGDDSEAFRGVFSDADFHKRGFLEAELVEDFLEKWHLWKNRQTRMSEDVNKALIHAIMHRVDRDNDGKISFGELQQVFGYREATLAEVLQDKGSTGFLNNNPSYTNLRSNRSLGQSN